MGLIRRNTLDGKVQGASITIKSGATDGPKFNTAPVSHQQAKPKRCRHYHKSPKFARNLAAEAFGPRYFGWRQWDNFVDLTPTEVALRRKDAEMRKSGVAI